MADRLVKVTDSEGNYTTFGYDKNNNQSKLIHKIDNNFYETSYSHDKDNRPDEVYYGEAVANNINVEYFPLKGTTTGSKGKQPITQNPVYEIDETGEAALAVTTNGIKALYDLGLNKNSGTMSLWINKKLGSGSHIVGNEGTAKQLINIYLDDQNHVKLAIRNNADVFTDIITTKEIINDNEWYFVALRWKLNGSTLECILYLNNIRYIKSVTDFKDFTGGKTALGTSINGLYPLNGLIKNFSYSSLALSDNEMLAMYHSSRIKYQYDTLGRLTKKTLNTGTNSYETSYSYVPGSATGATTSKLASISNKGVPIVYEYDANGNITKIIEGGMENLYYYNELNELVQEDIERLSKSIIYSYDLGGNIIGKREIPYGTGEPGTTITYGYDSTWKDKLISYNGKPITYDSIGNPLTYDGYTYSWEEGRRLKSIAGNSQNISYKYNDVGIRTEKNVDGVTTKYYLSGDKVILEDNGQDKIYFTYDSNDGLVSMNLNGIEYYYIRNGQGDIIGLFDSSGTEVVKYYYDSWGKLISIEGTLKDTVGVKNPYRYRGYRYDSETGLYYLQARYYNPEWNRFINADAEGGTVGELLSHNVFAYCFNNPVNMEDPTGNVAWWIIGAGVGAIVGGIAGAIYSYKKTRSVNWRYVAGGAVAGALVGAGLGYAAQAAFSAITTVATTIAATAIKTSEGVKTSVSKVQQTASRNLNIEKGINFTSTTAKHMDNPKRYVPVQLLREAIKFGTPKADPRGSDAIMYYTNMYRNGSKYNLEVLYHKSTNTIYHFEYARKAMGPLVQIFKK